ncbi:hypothetical protein BCR36DRAFT_371922 [Piromyces finnis]|uniref:Uncharacterized protein n=1 Tax=Piromyces finnis TaxID=1754191 RepID=A0A1Y1V4Q1_9FUNG|nr:hypothetical protein BCR36DRAFT_296234 [Piromyces finnis]ORX47128.1 hypothetical protein BCR36DRAFT_371922 [Piromyces finnis]|eukprot:ORX47127.1 hypothetical protein BCR36DRAFT_296234 [Piromyces finnis]
MLRYSSHHNYEKKAVRKSHDKTQSNKRKSKKNHDTSMNTTTTTTEAESTYSKPSKFIKNNKKYGLKEIDYLSSSSLSSSSLNQNSITDDYSLSNNRIHTDTKNKRQNSRKNAFIVNMLYEE